MYEENLEVEEVPANQISSHINPHLSNLFVGLSKQGTTTFEAHDWTFAVDIPHFATIPDPMLYKSDKVHLLRGTNCETGISFYHDHSRHFFFFGLDHSVAQLALNLQVYLPFSCSLHFSNA